MVMMKEWFTSVTSKILKLSFADSCHHALHCKETWPLRKGKLLETHLWTIRAQGSDWFFTIIQTDEERARVDMLAEQSMDFRWDCCFLLVISEDWQKSHQFNVDRKSASQERVGSTLLRSCCRRRLWVFKESLLGKVIGIKTNTWLSKVKEMERKYWIII